MLVIKMCSRNLHIGSTTDNYQINCTIEMTVRDALNQGMDEEMQESILHGWRGGIVPGCLQDYEGFVPEVWW